MATAVQLKVRDFTKAILDFLRNYAIILSIGVLATVSDEPWIYIVFLATSGVLSANAVTYFPILPVRQFFIEHPRLNFKKAAIITMVIFSVPVLILSFLFTKSLSSIIEREVQQKLVKSKPALLMPCRFTLDLSSYRCL
ncbi:hypothetical protein MKK64_16305 [Methylobacterium sp. E-025]|uniref:hypothetical protein n=1 Tax=Methylobacterium sp. E-025 TaxID=2836561 RepID=UPI001FB8B1D9|nr:hypothetical protein [Methylobacterium sp. E-025]MCJ2112749.1 hypothetical protein [Methylobacterium sp. E-025]